MVIPLKEILDSNDGRERSQLDESEELKVIPLKSLR